MAPEPITAAGVARGLDSLLTNLPTEVILLHSPAGLIHFASHNAHLIFVDGAPVTNTNMFDRIHQDDQDRLRELFAKAVTRGDSIPPLTIRLVYPKQPLVWVVLFTVAVKDGSGKVIELHSTLRDVTQQIVLRDRIVEADKLAHMTNVLAKVGGWYADLDTGAMYWSDELKEVYEVDQTFDPSMSGSNVDTRDEHLRAFFSAEDFSRIEQAAAKSVEHNEPQVLELPMTTAHGNSRWLRLFLNATHEHDGKIRVYGATQDITEIKNREDEMEALLRELTYQRDSLEEFSHMVSHQFRAPLTNLTSIVTLLEDCTDEAERVQLTRTLGDAMKALNTTLDDVSQAVKVRQEVSIQDESLHVGDEIAKVKTQMAQSLRDTGAVLNIDSSALTVVEYPPVYFATIVRNLISNAIRFSRPGTTPEVTIQSALNNGAPTLIVTDNGVGIDLEKHNDRLFKLGRTFHRNASGRGVGLFMVRTIVESMGGAVKIESQPDRGTTVTVFLKRSGDAQ